MRGIGVALFFLCGAAGCGPHSSGELRDAGTQAAGTLPDLAAPVPDGPTRFLGADGGCGLRTCASAHANCGPIGDGCGGLIDCGTCPVGQTCGGGVPSQCSAGGCVPRTCQSAGAGCGPVGDGCGGLLDCGKCPNGQSCGGGGTPSVCGAPRATDGGVACVPRSCLQLGFDCGPAGDGCGGLLDCGKCPNGQACGLGGKPGVCGADLVCTPTTCIAAGANCGPLADGCGGLLDCGKCPMGEVCGGGGQPGVCAAGGAGDGAPTCVPKSCQQLGFDCGFAGDGCGGLLDCRSCTAPQTCGGGGQPSVCGGNMGCVPKSCQSAGANCGPIGDGCGGVVQCGPCPPGLTCGGGGAASKCGVPPGPGCTPKTCGQLGYDCGPAGDGCGGLLDCGQCPNGEACGTGGKPSVCGPANGCTPATCKQLGYDCGLAGDGCGGVIDCGGCSLPYICGGGGGANQCGNSLLPDGGACVNLCNRVAKCDGGSTTVSGTVYAPTNPNLGYGNPDPLYGALVYVPNSPVAPFGPGVSCERCGAGVSGSPLTSATSGVDGTFVLSDVPCGADVPLVIQLGRWRRQVVIPQVACCADNALTPDQTRLPRNRAEGDIPLLAVVTGGADPIECVLPKIGIDAAEFTLPSGNGRVRLFVDNGATVGGNTPPASALWGSPAELAKYDGVIFDCVGEQKDKPTVDQQNVIAYANAGGRVFASHFSYVWIYNDAPFSTTASWDVSQTDPPDLTALVDTSFPKGMALGQWLSLVGASPAPGQLPVQVVRHDFDAATPPAQRWLYAEPKTSPSTPLEYTFNTPVGAAPAQQCGRVLFSDFHVNTGGAGTGTFPGECGAPSPMTPQEKVLEFMLFDLTSCIQPDLPTCTPRTCQQLGAQCGEVGDGCGNVIDCGDCPVGQSCGAGGPNRCGAPCTPVTCQQLGIQCGPAGDGCGNLLQCGACPMGQSCGGGGTPGVCGAPPDMALPCQPLTCQQQGLACGPAGDGCGNVIDCGTCPMGQTCGGGGTPGVCGASGCSPRSCVQLGVNCGWVADGCGGVVNCGSCLVGQVCGGCLQPNVCCGIQ